MYARGKKGKSYLPLNFMVQVYNTELYLRPTKLSFKNLVSEQMNLFHSTF